MREDNIRENFHKLIDKFNDRDMLNTFYDAMEQYQTKRNSSLDITDELSPDQIKRLEEAIKQAKSGKTIPDSEVREEIRKWFTR